MTRMKFCSRCGRNTYFKNNVCQRCASFGFLYCANCGRITRHNRNNVCGVCAVNTIDGWDNGKHTDGY